MQPGGSQPPLFGSARSGPLAQLPAALSNALGTGHPVAARGYAIVTAARGDADLADPVLTDLGLGLARATAAGSLPDEAAAKVIELRLGLLYRILDMAHRHLSARQSFGVKSTQHQLVKATFARVHMEAQLILAGLKLGHAGGFNASVTALTHDADRLMGGHGFLLGGTHAVSYLSDMFQGHCDA